MDQKCATLTLYTAQTASVLRAIERDGTCYNRRIYVREKYGPDASLFLTAYEEFIKNASQILKPPSRAELPYWVFADPRELFSGPDSRLLKLEVPQNQVILFDVYDWNRILQMEYLGKSRTEQKNFDRELNLRGITARDAVITGFYPEIREEILCSWKNLFCHHQSLLRGDCVDVRAVQGALWEIRKEWIRDING